MSVNKILVLFSILLMVITTSCSTSDVVSKHRLQKRKYNKGWHFNGKKRYKTSSVDSKKLLVEEGITETLPLKKLTTPSGQIEKGILQSGEQFRVPQNTPVLMASSNNVLPETRKEDPSQVDVVTHLETTALTPLKAIRAVSSGSINEAKRNYSTTWVLTILAIVALVAGIILVANSYIGFHITMGILLLISAVVCYVFMFVYLVRTVKILAVLGPVPGTETLRFFAWAHVVIGSLVSILLFFIPLSVSLVAASRARKSARR